MSVARYGLVFALASLLSSGCAVNRFAVNRLGDAMAGGGSAFASDDDPDLIRDAAPFSLKLVETLLSESPDHRGLRLAAASGFTQYSYAFLQQDAEAREATDLAAATHLRERARRMYRRARDHGLRGLEVSHRGLSAELRAQPKTAVQRVRSKAEVPLLYWTAAAWAGAIALSKNDPETVADVPVVEALIDRALVLDESYDAGAIHCFLIGFEMVRRGAPGDPVARARQQFDRAVALSHGQMAGPFVTWAEAVSVSRQNRPEFEKLLHQALAIDADAQPAWRLANLVMQRRARWLLSRTDELFVE